MTDVSCYVCKSSSYRPWAIEQGFHAVKCSDCGLVYVRNRPGLDEISLSKQTGMHATDAGGLNVTGRHSQIIARKYTKRLKRLFPEFSRRTTNVRWLDIGAGYGELLQGVRSLVHPDSQLVGIEPNEVKREHARESGLDVVDVDFAGDLGTFDVVSLVDVFSHLPDPPSFIDYMMGFLKPSGSIVLVTGNAADLASRDDYPDPLYLPDHLCFTGEEQLSGLMAQRNMRVAKIERFRLDTPYRCLKNAVKAVLGRDAGAVIPYRSRFRSIWLRCEQ